MAARNPAISAPRLITRLPQRKASGEIRARRLAYFIVAWRSSAAGTMRLIMPNCNAVLASIVSPKNNSSRARLRPMNQGITINGPRCENRTSGSPNLASSAAIVRSHISASSQPPPST